MPYTSNNTVNVFLSYAKEDQAIADALASTIRSAFPERFDITMMSEFPSGMNWRKLIDDSIDATDVMIAIATGRLRASHSFTGFEVGSFSASMRYRPQMNHAAEVERRMIPFAVLEKSPAAIDDFEGIDINPTSLHAVKFDMSGSLNEIGQVPADGGDETTGKVVKLLSDIYDIQSSVGPKASTRLVLSRERLSHFNVLARALCQQIFADISNREKTALIPKSRLIIRIPAGTRLAKDALVSGTVQTAGPSEDLLGSDHDGVYTWKEFLALATGEDIAYSWNEAFSSILDVSDTSDFVENNTILSFNRKHVYRIFVSKFVILYSGVREYYIYAIPILKPKDYGDPVSTMLLKALQVSLGYRFMFLEASSPYSPSLMKAVRLSNLQATVLGMQNSLNMLLYTAEDGGLNSPEVIVSILGNNDVQDVYAMWDREKNALYESAQEVLSRSLDMKIRNSFIDQLTSFCNHTRSLNKHYTASVMNALQARVGEEREH